MTMETIVIFARRCRKIAKVIMIGKENDTYGAIIIKTGVSVVN